MLRSEGVNLCVAFALLLLVSPLVIGFIERARFTRDPWQNRLIRAAMCRTWITILLSDLATGMFFLTLAGA